MRRITVGVLLVAAGCGGSAPRRESASTDFLKFYNDTYQRLSTVASEASWRAATDVNPENTGGKIGADSALAAFQGSRYVVESARAVMNSKADLPEIEFRQYDKILLNAAESPGTIPEAVQKRIQAEAKLKAALDGFVFCLEPRGTGCAKPTTPNEIDAVLAASNDLAQRQRAWEVSKTVGVALRPGLLEIRDLRNQVAKELGYSSYFHLQVADYGMSVDELMKLMTKTLDDTRPLYDKLHALARKRLAARFKQPEPQALPAHWVGNRWAQEWPGLQEDVNLDDLFQGRTAEWVMKQSERFYLSIGFPALPASFWEKSDLYALPPGAARKKNTHGSAWHIDLEGDVRSLMSVKPNQYWFSTAHHELGHIYYYLAYTRPEVPPVLRGGANRAFHEAVGDLIALAARQEPYLRSVGLLPAGRKVDATQLLLSEAMENLVFLPFAAGTMTHYEHDLYEKKLPAGELNRRWWEYVEKFQRVAPPAPRGEEFCDACTKTHIIDDPAQYYDYAMATLIKHQLHDYIARQILKQDPRSCNYAGNRAVGEWLSELLRLGQTRDWRSVLKEKTGEEISSRALREYFAPLLQ